MSEKAIGQRKRLAMGDEPRKYAKGGMVTPRTLPKMPTLPSMPSLGGGALSPITKLKRNNGVPGMKKGGRT